MVYENVCMITILPTKRISALSQWKTYMRVLPTRRRRKPAGTEITSLAPYVYLWLVRKFCWILWRSCVSTARRYASAAIVVWKLPKAIFFLWRGRLLFRQSRMGRRVRHLRSEKAILTSRASEHWYRTPSVKKLNCRRNACDGRRLVYHTDHSSLYSTIPSRGFICDSWYFLL